MSLFCWLTIGALTGWLADTLAGMDGWRGLLLSIVVGIIAAILGGALYNGFSEAWAINPAGSSVGEFAMSFLTATALLIVARLARITG